MAAAQVSYSGLDALLTPEESVLILIDHQAFQFANMHSHEPQLVVGNVVALARTAKVFGVPTILTTVLEDRGGYILQAIQDEFPDQKPINRTLINAWQDRRLVDAVRRIGRRKLVMAGLWTEVCIAMPALQAQGENYESMRLRMRPAVFPSKRTPRRYSGWFRPASSRSLGSRCCANAARLGSAGNDPRACKDFDGARWRVRRGIWLGGAIAKGCCECRVTEATGLESPSAVTSTAPAFDRYSHSA